MGAAGEGAFVELEKVNDTALGLVRDSQRQAGGQRRTADVG